MSSYIDIDHPKLTKYKKQKNILEWSYVPEDL